MLLLTACNQEEKKDHIPVNWTKNHSTKLNKEFAVQEEIDIRLFLEMHKDWNMKETGSGLRIYIYEEGKEDVNYLAKEGDLVELQYEISGLDGTIYDKTKEDEYVEILVDKADVETGVQEALKLMSKGDRAKLIIPSHIGHGLIGDLDKIPPLSVLVVDLHILNIHKK